MHSYGVSDVEKLLHVPRSTIRALIASGFVSPTRGPRGAWRFSFQDLIVLRTAQALAAANISRRRITKSVRELRRHLPDAMPLSGLRVCAVADRVVVREGGSHWQAESGQYLLEFEADPADGSLSAIEPTRADNAPPDAQALFERGLALERTDATAALRNYEQAVSADPSFLDAHINLGRLQHQTGRLADAEQVYRAALAACGSDSVLLYNLGVLLDDMNRKAEAREAYETAIEQDPAFADCHYNLALLCEELAQPRDAIRHMARYRALIGGRSR